MEEVNIHLYISQKRIKGPVVPQMCHNSTPITSKTPYIKRVSYRSFRLFFFLSFTKLLLTGKKCVDEWNSHTMWVADSSGDIEDQFTPCASVICWDQFLRCPRCLNTAWKCHRPLLALDIPWHPWRIIALESRVFRVSRYLSVQIRQSLVWIPRLISDIQWASKCLCMSVYWRNRL